MGTDEQSNHELRVLESISEVSPDRWNAVVDQSSRGSVFHRHEWLEAVENGLGHAPRHLLVEKDGNPISLFPNFLEPVEGLDRSPLRRLVSVEPGFGGPLATTDTDTVLPAMLETVADYCTGRTVVHEIRALDTGYLRYNTLFQSHGYEPNRRRCRFLLHLSRPYEDILSRMSRSRRKGIDRGREGDAEVIEEAVTSEALERFYRTYAQVMDDLGVSAFPREFFESLLGMADRLLLVTARVDGEYAGGLLEILDDEQSSVHGYVAAVPREFFDHHVSELLYDYVVRWGIDNGYDTYDLGTTKPDYENGLFRYKEGFGGQLVPTLVWERGGNSLWDVLHRGRSLYLKHVSSES
ncbi:GNAT family N-acetyltransferase [Haloarcula nitratireducens]|uniref:GNAT family N-acetyltransferase n=1 Tax=Haloarcula nitratireducens TaxID=2487749 RepID=A0AAW4P8X2_9EURY|nr:GNAT family N-acetyltransferase [Halomicroarcula nitratireducens]MBX0294319.1 GNAT family N-acetyltransferase [Halomicroarcula nitratireducens]